MDDSLVCKVCKDGDQSKEGNQHGLLGGTSISDMNGCSECKHFFSQTTTVSIKTTEKLQTTVKQALRGKDESLLV